MNTKELRVLVVSPDLELMGGVAETVRLLLRELEGRVLVTHAVFGRRKNQKGLSRYLRPLLDLFSFAFLLSRSRFDVIHMNPSLNLRSVMKELFLFCVFCLFGYAGKILFFIHGWEREFFRNIVSAPPAAALLRLVMNRAGAVTVLAGEFRQDLIRAGVAPDRVMTVSTMVDMAQLPAADCPETECATLLYLSRIIEEKGVYEIMDAFGALCEKHEGLKLIMAGDGPEREKLMHMAEEKGLYGAVFPGYIREREKFDVLKKSCIFLLPTRYGEGCPVALLEAMGAGLVPVVAAAGGITDVIIPGETALLLDEISAESIARAVEDMLGDEERRKRISARASAYAAEHFSSAVVTDSIMDIYQRIGK